MYLISITGLSLTSPIKHFAEKISQCLHFLLISCSDLFKQRSAIVERSEDYRHKQLMTDLRVDRPSKKFIRMD